MKIGFQSVEKCYTNEVYGENRGKGGGVEPWVMCYHPGQKERPFSGHFSNDGMAGTTSAPVFETVRGGHSISLYPWVVSVVISTPEYTEDIM